jgi:hypothetical protein
MDYVVFSGWIFAIRDWPPPTFTNSIKYEILELVMIISLIIRLFIFYKCCTLNLNWRNSRKL